MLLEPRKDYVYVAETAYNCANDNATSSGLHNSIRDVKMHVNGEFITVKFMSHKLIIEIDVL